MAKAFKFPIMFKINLLFSVITFYREEVVSGSAFWAPFLLTNLQRKEIMHYCKSCDYKNRFLKVLSTSSEKGV